MSWNHAAARLAPVLALLACIAWVHAPTLTGTAHLTAHHDNLDGAAPLRIEAARQWHDGQIPLWNPWKRTGMPLLADTTAGAIYPGNFPFLFVPPPALRLDGAPVDSPVFRAMDQVAALHAMLAGLFMYAFLRTISLGAPASVLGALVFACSGTMGWFAAWYIQIQNSVVWLPLILAAVHKTSFRLTPGWIAIGGAAVALQFFAGFPETSFYSGVLAIAYAASLLNRESRWRPIAAVASIYLAGLLLAAVQLVPSVELQALSRRPGALPLEVFQSLPASASMVWNWVFASPTPALEFPPLAAYHFGFAAVLAAAVGLLGFSRRTVFFVAVLAVGFVLSIGAATPLSAWLHQVPGFNAFRHPFKHLFEVSFAMAGLAALGVERLSRRRSRWPLVVAVLVIVATCVSLRSNQAVLIAANPASVDTSGKLPNFLPAIEPGWRLLTPRSFFQKRDPELLLGDYPSQFGVLGVHGAGPFLWSPLAEAAGMVEEETTYRRGLFHARDRTLALLSCRYLMQTKQGDKFTPVVDPALWSVVGFAGDARLVERKDALPLARFVTAARCGDAGIIEATLHNPPAGMTGTAGATDPANLALVDCSEDGHLADTFSPPASLPLQVVEFAPGRIQLATEVPTDGRGFLVVSQADFPGWQAYADGVSTPIRRVHGLVQGVEVPGGTSRVELRYRPTSFLAGAATSAATVAVLLLANVVAVVRRRR